MSFSAAELRLLSLSDRVECQRSRWLPDEPPHRGHRPRKYGIGALSQAEAMTLLNMGSRSREIAQAAGVSERAVSLWRQRMGLS